MKLSGTLLATAVNADTVLRASPLVDFAQTVGFNVTSLGNWNDDFFESKFIFDTGDMALDADWELCWDNPYPPGKNEAEHEASRQPDGLKLDQGTLHWVAGTHRCFRGAEPLDAVNNEFIIPARHYILSKAGYFNNYYLKSNGEVHTLEATRKLAAEAIEDDIGGRSTSFVTPFVVSSISSPSRISKTNARQTSS